MACNCIVETEKRLAEHIPTTLSANQRIAKAPSIETVLGITVSHDLRSTTASDVTYEIDQTSKAGNVRRMKKTTKLFHTHCPWCGVKK